ncbi:carbohydrate ABC transporter substrate-binding protein (CUT1 family) [Paenibacillus cellulosilyticus]|uniref:Carbohydrate ABC transporter substrate-binding protein (CUT1 family) n=1 Tax=Paenibacillus cellulosilyticus TaxID=375489 RepID=A0A2V2YSB0_9BACL|nr:extracellular solute-binding protein [Paenibacillus cellulosilyticus]PWW01153.1 carbohydrate ABC transporter substrate-binding protein (CUT1 family) [Paenibacillus cellulosilyticus]
MHKRKLMTVMACLALSASMLAACGGGGSDKETTKEDTSTTDTTDNAGTKTDTATTADEPAAQDPFLNEKATISIYYPTPDQVENRKLEDDKIRRFTEKYPNVTIEKSDWHYNVDEIGIKMASNEAPTIFNTFATEAKFLIERGWAADITDLWNNYENKDQINPTLQNQFIVDGKVYGVVQKGYSTSTVVNKKMLDEKGVAIPSYDWTWNDMINTAKAVADPAKGIAGIAPMGKGNEAGWNWTNFLFEAGGQIINTDGGKVTAAFNSDAGVKALQLYENLRWDANAIPKDWALGWGDAVGAFSQGRTAMVIAGAEGPLEQALNQGGMKPEDVLTYPMPAFEAGGKHYGVLGGDYLVINPNASKAEQEAAFRYITFDYFSDDWLASVEKDIQARKAENKYFIPPQMNYFREDSDYGQKVQAIFDKYDNVYKYAPESNALLDGQPEAQYNTQEYYAEMTNVVQQVFSKKGVDLKAKLDEAAKVMQDKYFSKIEVK